MVRATDTTAKIAAIRAAATTGELTAPADVLFLVGVIEGLSEAVRILNHACVRQRQEGNDDRQR